MPVHDPALDDAIREFVNLLATAYLRLWLPGQASQVESPESASPHGAEG